MAQTARGLRTAEGGLAPLRSVSAQRELVRSSFADAVDGVDIVELQTGRSERAADILTLPGDASPSVQAAIAPLLAEIAGLRAELNRLGHLPDDLRRVRRHDLRDTLVVVAALFAAAFVLILLVKA